MLKLKQRFIHYILSITCTNLCDKILVHAVYAKTSCKNVETLRYQPFLFQIAASHTNDHDLLLLAILIRGEAGITSTRSLTGH